MAAKEITTKYLVQVKHYNMSPIDLHTHTHA